MFICSYCPDLLASCPMPHALKLLTLRSALKRMNILFVCTVNRMRSCTAETIWSADPRFRVRSAGIAPTATKQVNAEMIRWADKIFVMEQIHEQFIRHSFPDIDVRDKLIVLDIPDFYYYMEPELIDLLHQKIDPYLTV